MLQETMRENLLLENFWQISLKFQARVSRVLGSEKVGQSNTLKHG